MILQRLRTLPLPLLLSSTLIPTALLPAAPAAAAAPLVDVRKIDSSIQVDLSYNRSDNAFKTRLYQSNVALLREPVARRLGRVQARLRKQGYGLKVWDAYRPTSVHRRLWEIKPGTRYLSNPRSGSKHSRGAAVDLTLVDAQGRELEMPTPHDEFSPRAHRGATQGVSAAARKHARILEVAMRAEGFIPNRYEWWHYSDPHWSKHPLSNTPLPKE
jgi:zinc D-Ala-D-Ala dipeptidase